MDADICARVIPVIDVSRSRLAYEFRAEELDTGVALLERVAGRKSEGPG